MHARRRKKKVIEQLNSFFVSVDSQKAKAPTPLPSVPPIASKNTISKATATYNSAQKTTSGKVDMSLSEMLQNAQNGINKQKVQTQSIGSVYGVQNTTVDAGKVQELWVRYSRSIEQQDTHLYSLMQQIPTVENGTCVVATVAYNLQAITLRKSTDLINFLREQTGVASLTLDVRVVSQENEPAEKTIEAYTPKQKLAQMIEENKAIGLLVETFSLDVEY